MKIFLLYLFVFFTPVFLVSQCVTNVNFNTWQQGGQPANGNWSVQGGGSTVYQSVNGNPTFFLSPNNLMNVHVTGNFRTIDTDNDWMGFVFSFLNPMGATDSFDMWLFDWKKEPQGGASSGKSLCRVNGIIPPSNYTPTFWDHTNTPEFTVVQNSFGSGGWSMGTNHAFELYLTYARATIYVDGVLTFDRQDCFKPGRFGFYNYSQSDCIYSNFQYDLFVDFVIPSQLCKGDSVDIQFSSPCASGTIDYQNMTWNFGDGTILVNNNPSLANANVKHVFNTPGTYNVTLSVTDLGGCTATKTRVVTVAAPITMTPTLTQPLCNGGSNGQISVAATGGFGNYSYQWSTGTVGPINIGVTAGTYTVTASDGFCVASAQYTLNQPPPLSASVSSTNASCGANNGTATISIAGGTPPYQNVNWAGMAGYTATGLAPGFYIADFTDANGCSATLQYQGGSSVLQYSATIGSLPCGYTLSASSTNQICGNANDGSATVTVTGGIPPINITWSNGGTGATITGLAAGNYTYNYSDGNGQNFTGTVTVNPAIPLLVDLTTNGISCAGVNDGEALASVTSGGITPYSYTWSGGQPNNPVAQNLGAGPITVTVTDGVGCSATASDVVTGIAALTVSLTTVYDSCFHGGHGAALTDVTGGSIPYSYQWSNFVTTPDNLNIIEGTYVVTVTDNKNCSVTGTATVPGAPAMSQSKIIQDVLCTGDSTGIFAVIVDGGTLPYSYTWSSAIAVGSAPQNLPAGIYRYTVTDAFGCQLFGDDTLRQPDSVLLANSMHTDVTCNGASNGTITINVSGGVQPYTFMGNNLPYGTTVISGLAANTYSGMVTDSNGCTVALTETILEPGPQSLTLTSTDNPCAGASNGTADADFVNGTGAITYDWNPGGVQPPSRTNLLSGVYDVTATDANGCTVTGTTTINEPAAPVMNVTTVDATCFGASGTATANPSGGTAPYNYNWSNNAGNFQTISPLAGSYTVSASDANGCNQTAAFSINEPLQINVQISVTDVACFGDATGDVSLTASGGTGPNYLFAWSPNVSSSNAASNLSAGNYSITITDAANCSFDTVATVQQPAAALSTISNSTATSCFGSSDGTITTTPSGGTSGYTYNWTSGVSSTNSATGLSAGNYDITITDAQNCTILETVSVSEPTQLVNVIQPTDVTCYHFSNGSVNITTSGGSPTYSYSLSGIGQNSLGVFANLAVGNYSITTTDNNNCTVSDNFFIDEPDSVTLSVSPNPVTVDLGDQVELTTSTNQTGLLTYDWQPPNGLSCYNCAAPIFSGNYSTVYTVNVTNSSGCQGSYKVNVTVIPNYNVFIPNAFSPNGDGANDEWMIYGNIPGIKQMQMMVFNRIGEKVFDTNDINFKWDGVYKGQTLPPGVYVYVANFVWLNNHSDSKYKGTVTIVK